MDKLREAVEIKILEKTTLVSKEKIDMANEIILNLAQSVIDQKEPKEKELSITETAYWRDRGYNEGLHDFRLWNAKCLGELEGVYKDIKLWYSTLSHMNPESFITLKAIVPNWVINRFDEAIRNLFGDK